MVIVCVLVLFILSLLVFCFSASFSSLFSFFYNHFGVLHFMYDFIHILEGYQAEVDQHRKLKADSALGYWREQET